MQFKHSVLFTFAACCVLSMFGCDAPAPPQQESKPAVYSESVKTPPAPSARWEVKKEMNELDHTSKISLSSSDVYLRCSPKFEGYIVPDIPSLGHSLEPEDGHTQVVRYRIDDSPVKKQTWAISDDFTALFLPTATLRSALKGKKLVVEFRPEYVLPQTQTFDLDGLAEAARNAGCKF